MVRRMQTALAAILLLGTSTTTRTAADFLKFFDSIYVSLYRVSQEAQWKASTDVSEGHDGERTAANTALAVCAGDKKVIETCRALLARRKELAPVTARELDKMLLAAAEGPGTIPEVTASRVAAESRQATTQDGFVYKLDGKPVIAND